MKTLLGLTIAALAAAFVVVTVHAGGGGSIRVADYTAQVGDDITVFVEAADVPPPGLGAWAIDVVFDPSIVDAIDCQSERGGVCSPAFAPDTVRVTGAVQDQGITGSFPLASVTFDCLAVGTSALEVEEVLTTTADPAVEITDLVPVAGSITCSDEQPPVVDLVAPATPTPTIGLPNTGSGSTNTTSPALAAALVALTALALLAVGSAAILSRRTRG